MDRSKARLKGDVPFSWEKKPGVSKLVRQDHEQYPNKNDRQEEDYVLKLPPPPCPIESPRISAHDNMISIPLPPCTFQPPSRSSSRKGLRKQLDDPFLAAYKECTKSTKKGSKLSRNGSAWSGLRKGYMFNFSCKNSCSVRDDNLVRVSQVPHEISRER